MKKIVQYMIPFFIIFTCFSFANAQTETVKIKTSAICKSCKRTIEDNLSFEKGVKKSNLDLETKIVTVVYDAKKNQCR